MNLGGILPFKCLQYRQINYVKGGEAVDTELGSNGLFLMGMNGSGNLYFCIVEGSTITTLHAGAGNIGTSGSVWSISVSNGHVYVTPQGSESYNAYLKILRLNLNN